MTPQQAEDILQLIPQWGSAEWMLGLIQRDSTEPPGWLDLCRHAVQQYNATGLNQLLQAADVLRLAYVGQDWHEPPVDLLQRVARQVMQGQGARLAIGPPPPGVDPATVRIRDAWLRLASRDHASQADPSRRWQAPLPASNTQPCELPVLLYDSRQARGVLASVHLSLVSAQDAHLRLVPAPASSLLAITPSFAASLQGVTDLLRQTLRPQAELPLKHLAIAWDMVGLGHGLAALDGDSAGAALAVGSLWLLRQAAKGESLTDLGRITRDALTTTAITAALGPGGRLDPVGQVAGKADALLPLLQALQQGRGAGLTLHVSQAQEAQRALLQAQAPAWQGHASLAALLHALAEECEPFTPDQQALHSALLAPGEVARQPDTRLVQVCKAPMCTLRHYALRCWADWEESTQVQARFVPLAVAETALGPRSGRIEPTSFNGLHQLLAWHDGRSRHDAYVLRGAPGAGKSTLLRHHVQQLCRQALQDWQHNRQPAELPLYVPLAQLPADEADPVAWLRRRLHDEHAPADLLAMLQPGRPGHQRPALRLLLDGLNELPVHDAAHRNQRAEQVVAAFKQARLGPLPMLLSIRQHHIDTLGGLRLLRVDVQPWGPGDIQAYLKLRFPGDNSTWQRHWQTIQAIPAALDLCRTPLHLAGQCDLLEDGYTQALQDRAALFSAWLWQRLRRELGHGRHASKAADPSLWQDPRLLTAADRAAIADDDAWHSSRLRHLPLAGQLLPMLMQQAQAQWWADAGKGLPGRECCSVAVPWRTVALDLQDRQYAADDPRRDTLRQRWGDAVCALGLVEIDRVRLTFQFAHPAWGEWLASCQLLAGAPSAGPAAGPWRQRWQRWTGQAKPPQADHLQRLQAMLQRSHWPQAGTRRDADELAHLQQEAAACWRAVPRQVWSDLLQQGLTLPLKTVMDQVLPANQRQLGPAARLAKLRDYLAFELDVGMLTVDPQQGTCRADLGAWGARTGLDDALGCQRLGWRTQPAGWQMLIHSRLWTGWREACWDWLRPRLAEALLDELQGEPGRLQLPPPGDIDEVLGLALLGLADPAPWLEWLLANGHWQALAGVLPVLTRRLEPAGPWPGGGRPGPHRALQHLRRLLLLRMVDSGAAARRGLRAAGVLGLLQADWPGLPKALQSHWQRELKQAWRGEGRDLRQRLQAGLLLGLLGDNLRYELTQVSLPDGQLQTGLRPKPALWAHLGRADQATRYRIGGSPGSDASQSPAFTVKLAPFDMARYPVTVGEWQCFVDTGAYDNPRAPCWGQAGPAARAWLDGRRRHAPNAGVRPGFWGQEGFNNPLQPVVGITVFEAAAYAAWAGALYADQRQADKAAGRPASGLQLPTELQWEAGVRGPLSTWAALLPQPPWAHRTAGRPPGPLAFNHLNTRWGRPSPVGVFSASITRHGIGETAGNVWQWCANALPNPLRQQGYATQQSRQASGMRANASDGETYRALRGGSFYDAAGHCRPAYRDRLPPGSVNGLIGLRLVRCVLPHSEH